MGDFSPISFNMDISGLNNVINKPYFVSDYIDKLDFDLAKKFTTIIRRNGNRFIPMEVVPTIPVYPSLRFFDAFIICNILEVNGYIFQKNESHIPDNEILDVAHSTIINFAGAISFEKIIVYGDAKDLAKFKLMY